MKYRIGDNYSKRFVINDEKIVRYAEVSEDKNPVHLDNEYASKTIFKKRIAHGMLIGGFISSILGNDFPGNGTIYLNQTMSFKKPVFIDDEIEIKIEVVEIDKKGWLTMQTNCYSNNVVVVEGKALVIPPKY